MFDSLHLRTFVFLTLEPVLIPPSGSRTKRESRKNWPPQNKISHRGKPRVLHGFQTLWQPISLPKDLVDAFIRHPKETEGRKIAT